MLRRMTRMLHWIVVAGLPAFATLGGQTTATQIGEMSSARWRSLGEPERTAFVAGFVDCYTASKRHVGRSSPSFASIRARLDSLANAASNPQSPSLERSLPRLIDSLPATSDGERTSTEHGYFDGAFWRELYGVGGTNAQREFVDGYQSCLGVMNNVGTRGYSKQPDVYRQKISKWYRFDPDSGDMDEGRARTKIAEVFKKFHDVERAAQNEK